jgi:hypothetical protein
LKDAQKGKVDTTQTHAPKVRSVEEIEKRMGHLNRLISELRADGENLTLFCGHEKLKNGSQASITLWEELTEDAVTRRSQLASFQRIQRIWNPEWAAPEERLITYSGECTDEEAVAQAAYVGLSSLVDRPHIKTVHVFSRSIAPFKRLFDHKPSSTLWMADVVSEVL